MGHNEIFWIIFVVCSENSPDQYKHKPHLESIQITVIIVFNAAWSECMLTASNLICVPPKYLCLPQPSCLLVVFLSILDVLMETVLRFL